MLHAGCQVRSLKKVEAEKQRREDKSAREQAKKEREARSYTNVMQVCPKSY